MSREVLPGTTYLVTRRSNARFYLFRPDATGVMQRIFLYLLAVIAGLFGIQVHAAVLASTHYHLVITDTRGLYPKFLHRFNRLVALLTQCHRGWGGSVFNRSQTSMVELTNVKSMIEKMAYVIVNPVAAGAVRFHQEWPGFVTRVREIGTTLGPVAKPTLFFRSKKWPDFATLPITWPPLLLEHYGSTEAARAALQEEVERQQAKAHAEIQDKGWTFLGADRCKKLSVQKRAVAYEVWGSRNPTFATGGDRDLYLELIQRRRAFRAAYKQALKEWHRGNRNVAFPPGT